MITISRQLRFCAGHRLLGHEGHCAHLHGHNYTVEVSVTAAQLDDVGRVTDFREIKQRLGQWLDENWDHAFLVHEADTALRDLLATFEPRPGERQKLYILPLNPSAEGMAQYLLHHVAPQLFSDLSELEVVAVRVWETESCMAEARHTATK